jgi:benzodiazapine receptor
MNDYSVWYSVLEKPFFAPPEWVFGLAWGIIYPLIFIAFALLIYKMVKFGKRKDLLYLFLINILANISFTPVQFVLKSNIASSLVILLVLSSLIMFQKRVWKFSKPVFYLMTPYLLWGLFATVLQITITIMNF